MNLHRLAWAVMAALLLAVPAATADEKKDEKKPAPKKAADVFTNVADAGPDYQVQGEYVGEVTGKGKYGAQVVALGAGKFDAYFLAGGLPGAGWDGKTRVKVPAVTEEGKVTVTGSGWTGTIAEGVLSGKNPDGDAVALKHVERKSPTLGAKAPTGAVVLFDGSSADEWAGGKLVEDNLLFCGTTSKKGFATGKLHVEFRTPFQPKARGQGRGNSGVYVLGQEIQVLDSFGLKGDRGECGAFYGRKEPSVNMCLPPLAWQTYDVEVMPGEKDKLLATVWHNGVKIHEDFPIAAANARPVGIHLQNHGNPVVYRNIWFVPADKSSGATEPKQASRKLKVLLVTHSGGFIHSSVTEAEKVLKELGAKNNFEVTCWRFTNDPDRKVKFQTKIDGKQQEVEGTSLDAYSVRFKNATREGVTREQIGRINAKTLEPFDAVFFFTTGNPTETKEELKDLLDFIKSGKGFLGTHCATDTLYGMQEYGEMIGAYFDGHPMGGKTRVVVEDRKHPITQGLGSAFEISDELYQFRSPYARDKLRVLMRLDPLWVAQRRADEVKRAEDEKAKLPGRIAKLEEENKLDEVKQLKARLRSLENFKPSIRRTDNDYAMAWVRDYGKGRVFYTALGHGENVWRDPRFQNMVVQAIRWVTRDIRDGESAPSASAEQSSGR